MTKDLYLIRHATAEETTNSSMVKDFDRDLISRGFMESARIGKHLFDLGISVDAIYTSPAIRTMTTAKLLAEQLKFNTDDIEEVESLYGSGPRAYLALLNGIPADVSAAIVVGHNPDISFFADYLSSDDCGGSMSKATVIQLQFEDLDWTELTQKSGILAKRIDVKDLT